MRPSPRALILGIVGFCGCLGTVTAPAASVAAVFSTRNRAGDRVVAEAVQQALRNELDGQAALVDPGRTRAALRRLRIRDLDAASSDLLRQLATELEADWLIAPILHDVERRGVPRITVSARAYDGSTGAFVWVGFHGGSGLDDRTVLGLGAIDNVEALVPVVVARMTEDLADAFAPEAAEQRRSRHRAPSDAGRVAIVPLDGLTRRRATANAGTLTEATRAVLHRRGFRLVTPGCVGEVLRRQQSGLWGGVVQGSREELRSRCGADLILTGSVESYDFETGGDGLNPRVAVALRLVDPVSGRILWMDAVDRTGRQLQGLFRAGRLYSRGALAARLTDLLVRRLHKQWPLESRAGEE